MNLHDETIGICIGGNMILMAMISTFIFPILIFPLLFGGALFIGGGLFHSSMKLNGSQELIAFGSFIFIYALIFGRIDALAYLSMPMGFLGLIIIGIGSISRNDAIHRAEENRSIIDEKILPKSEMEEF